MDPIADFMVITGCEDEDIAIHYLSESNFDAGIAASVYMADRGQHPLTTDDVIQQPSNPNTTNSSSSLQPPLTHPQLSELTHSSTVPHPAFDVENETNVDTTRTTTTATTATNTSAETPQEELNAPHQTNLPSTVSSSSTLFGNDRLASAFSSFLQGTPFTTNTSAINNPMASVDTLSSAFPSFTGMGYGAPRFTSERGQSHAFHNTFDQQGNARLSRMFTTPQYVHPCSDSITEVCEIAARNDFWVIFVIRDGEFRSACLTRDVWNSAEMEVLHDTFLCAEADIRIGSGRQIAQGFRVPLHELPVMFIIDPITMHQELKVKMPCNSIGVFDSAAIIDTIEQFIFQHGTPHEYLERRHGGDSSEMSKPEEELSTSNSNNVIDVDDESSPEEQEEEQEQITSSEPLQKEKEKNLQETSKEESTMHPQQEHIPAATMDIWLAEDNVDSKRVFRLRCRLPHSTQQLSLRPETPLAALRNYLLDCLRRDNDSNDKSDQVALLAGVPPRELQVSDWNSTTLEHCTGLRSGDVVIAKVVKSVHN